MARNEKLERHRLENFNRPQYRLALPLLPEPLHFPKVCELGCGRCEFARILRDKGFEVTCVDVIPEFVEEARKFDFEAFLHDLNKPPLPFRDKMFDLVTALEVLEHLWNAEACIREVHRILKPSGRFILTVPNAGYWGYRLRILFGKEPSQEGRHFRFFTKETLERKLRDAGFKVEYWGHRPFRSLWPSLLSPNLVAHCKRR